MAEAGGEGQAVLWKLVLDGGGEEKGKRQGRRVIDCRGGGELWGAEGLDDCEEAEWGGQYLRQGGGWGFGM